MQPIRKTHLEYIFAQNQRTESISHFRKGNLGEQVAGNAWDVAITHAILGNQDVVAQFSTSSSGGGNADVGLDMWLAVSPSSSKGLDELTMYPTSTIFFAPIPCRNWCKSVLANELG